MPLDTPNFFGRKTQTANPALDAILRQARLSGNPRMIPDTNLTREYTGANQTFADPTAAMNAGAVVTPWANSSGAGPGTYGYRGSYGGGYGGGYGRRGYGGGYGGQQEKFHTGRPSASTADEYYRNRDAAIGNPLEMLKLNGPGRSNPMQALINEARLSNGAVQGTDAYYAGKGLGPDGKPKADDYMGDMVEMPPSQAPESGYDQYGTKNFAGGDMGLKTPTGMDLYGPKGKIGSSTFGAKPVASVAATDNLDRAMARFNPEGTTTASGGLNPIASSSGTTGKMKVPLASSAGRVGKVPTVASSGTSGSWDDPTKAVTNPPFNPADQFGTKKLAQGGMKYLMDILRRMRGDVSRNLPSIAPVGAFGG